MRTRIVVLTATLLVAASFGMAASKLTEDARKALVEALAGEDGEYASQARYDAIIRKHGELLPYMNIRRSEGAHIQMLKNLFDKYGIDAPADPHTAMETTATTLAEAAAIGVKSEEDNVAMYDRLLPAVRAYPDIRETFEALRMMSREHHLQAFQRAASGGGRYGGGAGGAGGGGGRGFRGGRGATQAPDGETTATAAGGCGGCGNCRGNCGAGKQKGMCWQAASKDQPTTDSASHH
jgi:hypothetical protein